MVSSIPYNLQYIAERERNQKFQWLTFGITFILLALHGLFFHWGPRWLRKKRTPDSIRFKGYFKVMNWFKMMTGCESLPLKFWKTGIERRVYFQPSLALLSAVYIMFCGLFSYRETADIDYLPRYYVCAKRVSRVAIGKLIPILVFVFKNDLVSAISGVGPERLVWMHKWLSRLMWAEVAVHFVLSVWYWVVDSSFMIMIQIPPQIFGMMAFGFFSCMVFGSLKFIRNWAYDGFLLSHRICNFLYLLFAFFHNGGNKAAVLIAVHTLVADRILTRVVGIIHAVRSPTNGICYFKLKSDDTLWVSLPVATERADTSKLYRKFLPSVNTWKPGMHCYLTVPSISAFQMHPFSIGSLPDSRQLILVIRKRKGFTKKLFKEVEKLQQMINQGVPIVEPKPKFMARLISFVTKWVLFGLRWTINKVLVKMNKPPLKESNPKDYDHSFEQRYKGYVPIKASFSGPVGGKMQTLIPFDASLFIAGGTGASFTFPVCLNLLREHKLRDDNDDVAYRARSPTVHCIWMVRNRSHIKWYDYLIKDLIPFIKSGRLRFEIYVTRDNTEIDWIEASSDDDDDDDKHVEMNVIHVHQDDDKKVKNENTQKVTEIADKSRQTVTEIITADKSIETVTESSSSSSTRSFARTDSVGSDDQLLPYGDDEFNTGNKGDSGMYMRSNLSLSHVTVYQKRPQIDEIIDEAVSDLMGNTSIYKGLAVLLSGPSRLAGETSYQVTRQRRRANAPDIYFHCESYD
ncbi:hypothetical protein DIURU_005189 [Diutina rugosa]|uniref:ferric-chelate reductase (NADPH) n=1 Tax=Diutina rugosa TaxID=5481 RepID=A0A642UIN3_DIURU|nr:uncharacterized protein DIURU_005189 [Diutina rugosa]KAA8897590.1 hypothetical protein DIURU_005189 [Diutina rugosa]